VLKDKYGKESEIIKCYVKEIIDLPHITSSNPRKIAEFSEKLTYCVQALETMKKLNLVNGNVSMTLEKLSGIRGDLVRTDASWESWDFVKLVDSLHQRLRRNLLLRLMIPIATIARNYSKHARNLNPRAAFTVGTRDIVSERKRILARKGLCFNCATKPHRAPCVLASRLGYY
jgi:hypothetical protein